jgi:hypothetical protein
LAEGEGFEPPGPFPVQRFSRPPPSTTRPSLRGIETLIVRVSAARDVAVGALRDPAAQSPHSGQHRSMSVASHAAARAERCQRSLTKQSDRAEGDSTPSFVTSTSLVPDRHRVAQQLNDEPVVGRHCRQIESMLDAGW